MVVLRDSKSREPILQACRLPEPNKNTIFMFMQPSKTDTNFRG